MVAPSWYCQELKNMKSKSNQMKLCLALAQCVASKLKALRGVE